MVLTSRLRAIVAAMAASALTVSCGQYTPSVSAQPPTWQGVDLPGVLGGFRAATYDPGRDCLWILTRYFQAAGHPLVTLTQLNLQDRSSHSMPLQLAATGFIRGSVAVDSRGAVWMSWGRTLVEFDPNTKALKSWPLPSLQGAAVAPQSAVLDGNAVSIEVASNGEIWVAAHSVRAIFGFSPPDSAWSRTIQIPLTPTLLTRIGATSSGDLLINGIDGSGRYALARMILMTGNGAILKYAAVNYVVTGTDTVIYEDDTRNVGRLSLSNNSSATLATPLEIANDPVLATDTAGNVWFSLVTAASVGVGKIDALSGAESVYAFPPIQMPSGAHDSCPGVNPCANTGVVLNPDIQSIVVDRSRDIWVITGLPGTGADPGYRLAAPPIYELPAAY
jgi:hypothetical protein